jgi:hypothetical protein
MYSMGRAALLVAACSLAGCDGKVSGPPSDGQPPRDQGPGEDVLRQDGAPDGEAPPDGAGPVPDGGGPDPCNPLPEDCLCAQACQAGECDNTKCPCPPISGASYGTLSIGTPCGCDPAKHGDMNLLLRKWQPAPGAVKGLVDVSGPTDGKAPQLCTLFADERVPSFPEVYRVEYWDWGCNCPKGYIDKPEVTLAGMGTSAGEVIRTPGSGYDVGGGHTAVVIHAAKGTITLKYTAEDNVVYGYTVHLAGICVEPTLQALYDQCHAAGRKQLPALKGKQPLGRALAAEIQVSIRDTGSWMDPRVRKDWWQGK